jgi:hypothetical protein
MTDDENDILDTDWITKFENIDNSDHLHAAHNEWEELIPINTGGYWGLKNHQYFLLNKKKKEISSVTYDYVRDFSCDKFAVLKDGNGGSSIKKVK